MKKPFFSVIIPTFNHASFLEKALKSVFQQSFKNYEVLVIDNYSSDHTSKVVNSFKGIKYKKIHNKGVIAKSRNLGIKLSKGKWIAFLDADDYWLKNKLKIIYKLIRERKFFDLVCHSEWILNFNNHKKKLWCYGPYTKNFYKDLLIYGNRISTSASVVNIAQNNGVFSFLNKPLGFHTFYRNSASSNQFKHFLSQKSVIKDHVYKVQSFTNKKKELFKKVINIIDLKNEMLKFKNEKFSINNICNLIKISYKEPIMTLRYYSYFFSKLLKQIFLQYIYS
jgi:glycosyltransferase involved in cell wall biosynthesis